MATEVQTLLKSACDVRGRSCVRSFLTCLLFGQLCVGDIIGYVIDIHELINIFVLGSLLTCIFAFVYNNFLANKRIYEYYENSYKKTA